MIIVVNLTSVPFVLGLIVELEDCYIVTSNRESGFGRYDVMLEPRDKCDDAFIIEFKVQDSETEKDLEDTVNIRSMLQRWRQEEFRRKRFINMRLRFAGNMF